MMVNGAMTVTGAQIRTVETGPSVFLMVFVVRDDHQPFFVGIYDNDTTCGVVTLPRFVVELQCAWRCLVLLLAPVACGVLSFWPVALHLECFGEATC